MHVPSPEIMQSSAYMPILTAAALHLSMSEIKLLASVSHVWRAAAREALLAKVNSSQNLNDTGTIEQIGKEIDDFLAHQQPLERALRLAEIYTRYNPNFFGRSALKHPVSNSKAFLALTSILYKKFGHEKCFKMLLSIKNSFQQTKALVGFCYQAKENEHLSVREIMKWVKVLRKHIKKHQDPLLIKELSEILFQGAFSCGIQIFFYKTVANVDWQKLFFSIIKASKPAQDAESNYQLSVIRRLSLYLYEILKSDKIVDKKSKVLNFFTTIPQKPLKSQLAHSLCNRFYVKAFNATEIPDAWEITAELAEIVDIGYTLEACTQTRFENWLWHSPENISPALKICGSEVAKFHGALINLLDEFPNFIEQASVSLTKLTAEMKLAIYQDLINMLLHYDQLTIAIKVVASRQDDLISQALKVHIEGYCHDAGIHEIDYSPLMDIEDSTTKTISFHSDSEEFF